MKTGLVSCNGEIVRDLGRQIDPEKDVIKILPAAKTAIARKMTVAIYKPRQIACSKVRGEGKTVFDLLPQFKNLNVVGRLDKESEGLLLLSNDGSVTAAVTGEKHETEKEYVVTVQETVAERHLQKMRNGMVLEDGPTLPAKAKARGPHEFSITLLEGRNHQIRRMANALRLTVMRLKRIRVGRISLGDMKPGDFRMLSQEEISALKRGGGR